MRDKINRLAKGDIEEVSPVVSCVPNSIDGNIQFGTNTQASIHISSENGIPLKGLAYSSESRVTIDIPAFTGMSVDLTLNATFRVADPDTCLEGKITLVTNGGEFEIPYKFNRIDGTNDTVLDKLATIEDFALIAKEDPETALRIFEYKNFEKAPCIQDIRTGALYRAFYKRADKRIALEQFLKSCGIEIDISIPDGEKPDQEGSFEPETIDLEKDMVRERKKYFKKHFLNYLRTRLDFEVSSENATAKTKVMDQELQKLYDTGISHELITLLRAENEYLRHEIVKASGYIEEVCDRIKGNRQDFLFEYFLLEYLDVLIYNKEDKRISLIRLTRRFIDDEKMINLFFIIAGLDVDLKSDPVAYRNFMIQMFNNGLNSPLLYLENCLFINDHPDFLDKATLLDVRSIDFGKKRDLLNPRVLASSMGNKIRANIRSNNKSSVYHKDYEAGIEAGLKINGLYEYFMYSLPDSDYTIPDCVLEYFSEGDNLDVSTRTKLYEYVVSNKRSNSNIFRSYEERINQFALNHLVDRKINASLARIYEKVLKPEMFDAGYSESLPYILDSYRIDINMPSIRSIIVLYPQISNEHVYPIDGGTAYIPIYNERAILLFQDVYGNRYYDIDYSMTKLINNPALTATVDKLFMDTIAYKLKVTGELLGKKNLNASDIRELEMASESLSFTNKYNELISEKLINYYSQHTASDYNPAFLSKIDISLLKSNERTELINAYISCSCYSEAYEIVKEYGISGITYKNLRSMCSGLIKDAVYSKDKYLIELCRLSIEKGQPDAILLDFLCQKFNGPTETMYSILKKAIESRSETYDMDERLLAQMIFINTGKHIDDVFSWYVSRKKVSESIVKAYFTTKTYRYFLKNEGIDDKTFTYLENAVYSTGDPVSLPIIYQLAMTKQYSEFEKLSEKQIKISELFTENLIRHRCIFPYIKELGKFIGLPSDIRNAEIIEYEATDRGIPMLRSRILPHEDHFKVEEPDCIFANKLSKRKILFNNESWQYEIVVASEDIPVIIKRGKITVDTKQSDGNDRFALLNRISEKSSDPNQNVAKEIQDYIIQDETARKLFDLI